MNNEFKRKLQEREFAVLKDRHRVILKWATGCGKSKMAIDLINYVIPQVPVSKNNPYPKVLFLVAGKAHVNNWQDEWNKWKLRTSKIQVRRICYNSLHKVMDEPWNIVVLDEAHHAFTEKRMAALEELKNNLGSNAHIYLLSATLSADKISKIEEIFGKFITSTVTLKDAIKDDILPDPKVYVIGMELDNTKRHQEIKIGNDPKAPVVKWEDRNKYIFKNIPCIIQCTEFQKNAYLSEKVNYWNDRYSRSKNEFHRIQGASYGSQRKRFLGELKTGVVRELIKSMPRKRRFVCFCASVAQADSLSKENTVSSKKPTKYNQLIIDAFNAKKINNIYAVGMITEGMNLTDIETGIIVQLDGKERLFIQKFGRSLRAEDPVTFIFYYRNTQDEKYLNNALENIDEKFIQRINVNQLNKIKL